MTLRFRSNVFISTVAEGYFAIKEFMKSVPPDGPGWTIKASSTGISGTYGSGDVISSATLFGESSWFILRDPSNVREIMYVMYPINGYNTAYIMYSKGAGFTGGSTTARPTATDEVCLFGLESGGVFTYNQLIAGSSSTPSNINLWADDSGEYANGWWIKKNTGDTSGCGFFMDEIVDYPSVDIDHVVFTVQNGNNLGTWDYVSVTGGEGSESDVAGYGCSSWLKLTDNSDYFGKINIVTPASTSNYISYTGGSFGKTFDNKSIIYPAVFLNGLTQSSKNFYKRRPYYKGKGKYLKLNPAGLGLCLGDMLSVNTPRDYIVYRGFIFPWDGGYLIR